MKAGLAPELRIREAAANDVAAIVALLADDGIGRGRERPGDPVYSAAFSAMRSQAGNVYLVAERVERLVGCLQFTPIHGLSRLGATRVQIEGVRVAASERRSGVGRALFKAAFERATKIGASLLQLTTDLERTEARPFYERLGFVATHCGMKRVL